MLHKLAIFLWPKFCQHCMRSQPERKDIHQDARHRIVSFTSGGEPAVELATKRSKTVVAQFEEWVNLRPWMTLLMKFTNTSAATMTWKRSGISWVGGKTTAEFSCYCQDWPVVYSASLQVVAAVREKLFLLKKFKRRFKRNLWLLHLC